MRTPGTLWLPQSPGTLGHVIGTPPFKLYVSGEAIEKIHGEGGRIFIWSEPIGAGVQDRVSCKPPEDEMFHSYLLEKRDLKIWICVPEEFAFEQVSIELRRWPFRGFRVMVDDLRWGWRGDAWNLMPGR